MKNRRDFLKTSLMGAGAFAFAPYLNAAGSAAAKPSFPKRFVFMRVGNGLFPDKLVLPNLPKNLMQKEEAREAFEVGLDKYELPDYLKCLNDHKENMTILQGMSSKMSMNGHHSYQSIMGLFHAKDANVNTLKRASIDYELSRLFPSPLGHVELSLAGMQSGIVPGWSVPAPYQKNFCYADPITAYNNLFQCVLDPKSMKMDIDMFAHASKTEALKVKSFKGFDNNAQANHVRSLDTIKDSYHKLLGMSAEVAGKMPDRNLIYSKGKAEAFSVDKQEAMAHIAASILTTGLTNSVTYTMDNLDFNNSGLPGLETERIHNHSIGHGNTIKGVTAHEIRKKVRIHHFNQMKLIVEALKAQPEGSGTMFDNTMIMYFPEGGEKHHAEGKQSPWVVMSGKNCSLDIAGRYVRFPSLGNEGHMTLGNWYTSLLNAHGNPIKHYGDLDPTMSKKNLPQEGPIKRFLRA